MAYVQYTHCTPTASFSRGWSKFMNSQWQPGALFGAGLVAIIVALFIAAAVPVAGMILILAGGGLMFAMIVAAFEYLLGGKLICLGGDKIAIGRVLSNEPPSSKSGFDALDNDFSINLLLCPHLRQPDPFPEPWPLTWEDAEIPLTDPTKPENFQDFLVREQTASSNHGCPFTGYEHPGSLNRANFHIELEGSRIHDVYEAFLAAWAILVAAAIAAAAVAAIPGIGWLLALLIMLLAALLGGAIVGATWGGAADGSFDDPDPVPGTDAVGELHTGDYIVGYGTWTFDAGHNDDSPQIGWNELHPIKYLGKAYKCADEKQAKEWEEKIVESFSRPIRDGTDYPERGWKVHPVLDGCDPNRPG